MVNVLLELQRPVNWLVITVKVNILLELLLPVIDYSNFIVNTMLKSLLTIITVITCTAIVNAMLELQVPANWIQFTCTCITFITAIITTRFKV